MIPWWVAVIALFVGGLSGVFSIALMEASRDRDNNRKGN